MSSINITPFIEPVPLPPKYTSETVPLTVDFSGLLPTGDSLPATPLPTVTATNISGASDPTPQNIVSGPASVSGTKVLQNIIGGVGGAFYLVSIKVTTTLGYIREGQVTFWIVNG